MRVRLWGIRGSLPSPQTPDQVRWRLEEVLTQFARLRESNVSIDAKTFLDTLPPHLVGGYGGNTTCAEVTSGSSRLLIDAGSGLRAFSDHILKHAPSQDEFHFYLTHFHWDHLIGLPMFVPLYMKGKTIHIYAVHDDLEKSLETLFTKPNFPVPYNVIKKQLQLHKLEPRKPFAIGALQLTPYKLDHPDPCWGVRVEGAGKALAWAVDTECTRISSQHLGEDTNLYKNADLLVFDAQYSFEEAIEKINWGHSSAPIGIDLAIRENVKLALFAHHDPSATDEEIFRAEVQTKNYYDELIKSRKRLNLTEPTFNWRFAREGETIQL